MRRKYVDHKIFNVKEMCKILKLEKGIGFLKNLSYCMNVTIG